MTTTTTMNNNTTVNVNVSEAFRQFAQSVMDRAARAYAEGRMTAEECVQGCDRDIDVLKGSFFATVDEVSRLVGIKTLRLNIARVFEHGCNASTGKKDLYHMAREIRAIVDEEIADLETCWDTESADILRKAFHEDCLAETFVKSVVWLAGKLWKKLKKLAGYVGLRVDEKSIIGTVCCGIGAMAHLVGSGVKVVVNIAKYAVSLVGAGALMIADYVLMGLTWLFSKAKALWNKAKGMLVPVAEEEELEEDFEEEFEEE